MIWVTVSSWSCFCWLYGASPSLAAKNIINLILVLTIWWCPCVASSHELLEEGVCQQNKLVIANTLFQQHKKGEGEWLTVVFSRGFWWFVIQPPKWVAERIWTLTIWVQNLYHTSTCTRNNEFFSNVQVKIISWRTKQRSITQEKVK